MYILFFTFQSSLVDNPNMEMYGHPVPLTAYVLIALYKIETEVSGVSTVEYHYDATCYSDISDIMLSYCCFC